MQRPPAWLGLVLLGLLLGSARARLLARARASSGREGGAASFLLAGEPDPRRWGVRELRSLPGVGETLARAIAATRARRAGAPFAWEEVPGIGPGRAGEIRSWLQERGFAPEPFDSAPGSYAQGMKPASRGALEVLAALVAGACSGEPTQAPAPAAEVPALRPHAYSFAGIELSVLESGAGSNAVILLHGARYSRADWLDLGTLARLQQQGVRVLALDWPGAGTSPVAASEPEPAELLAQLLTVASIERAVLVGPSRGGGQALALAARGDARLAGLFLIAPAGAETFQPGPGFALPTLLLWGEDDDIVPLSAGRALAARLPGARLEVCPGAGHACYLAQPERFHGLLEGFLGELGLLER